MSSTTNMNHQPLRDVSQPSVFFSNLTNLTTPLKPANLRSQGFTEPHLSSQHQNPVVVSVIFEEDIYTDTLFWFFFGRVWQMFLSSSESLHPTISMIPECLPGSFEANECRSTRLDGSHSWLGWQSYLGRTLKRWWLWWTISPTQTT